MTDKHIEYLFVLTFMTDKNVEYSVAAAQVCAQII